MTEPSKRPHKKKLPKNIAELPDREVAKYLFGKKAAKAIEEIVEPPVSPADQPIEG